MSAELRENSLCEPIIFPVLGDVFSPPIGISIVRWKCEEMGCLWIIQRNTSTGIHSTDIFEWNIDENVENVTIFRDFCKSLMEMLKYYVQ